jgi:pimeloyl-ACP methyl ester carboxylesterase
MLRPTTAALAGAATIFTALALPCSRAGAQGSADTALLSIDHYVPNRSTVPSIAGQTAEIYVRERARHATILRGAPRAERVVLFVHGAGTPAEVAFDVPYADYSWMAYLANAGFDVFSMDMTGYGRSTRPSAMNEVCNLPVDQQAALGREACKPALDEQLTTIASDWNDLDAVVDYIRALRGVARVSLVGWSQGGPRTVGYTAQHADKIDKIVVLAPAYNRASTAQPPTPNPAKGPAFNAQSHADFAANWDKQVGCADQYEPAASDAVWGAMLASDPVGATWGQGVRRAPNTTVWGFGQTTVARIKAPVLMITGIHDKQIAPQRVHELYEDLGSEQKVLVDLACSSHNAMWERNHLLLFHASLEWLTAGTVEGMKTGVVKLGY